MLCISTTVTSFFTYLNNIDKLYICLINIQFVKLNTKIEFQLCRKYF